LRCVARWALAFSALACSYDYDAATRCQNGKHDGDETGVDCGGSCVVATSETEGRCGYATACKVDSDCEESVARCEVGRCTPRKLTPMWRVLTKDPNAKGQVEIDPPRQGGRLTFGPQIGILVGGYSRPDGSAASTVSDTWKFADGVWQKQGAAPPGRFYHGQVYDRDADQVMIAGGEDTSNARFSDVLVRDYAGNWNPFPVPLPTKRSKFQMAYDELSGRILLFGGEGVAPADALLVRASGSLLDWDSLDTNDPPPVPNWHAMVYHAGRHELVVFGGRSSKPGQTSILDLETNQWSNIDAQPRPSGEVGCAMAYDSHRERIVLFGGIYEGVNRARSEETWEWDGEGWIGMEPLDGEPRPPLTSHGTMGYDPISRRMILLAGGDKGYDTVHPETWTYTALGWPCSSDEDCGEGTFCVDDLCCNSLCEGGVCNDRDQPGVCR